MAYSDNFGQIMLQGHQNREARRQAGEIAQLRYGNSGNKSGGSSGDGNDELQWLKAGQELAKQEAQMKILGEQQAEQIRQRQTQLLGEYAAAKAKADKANKTLDTQSWLMQRGYFSQQIDPSDPRSWGQTFSEGTNGVINEQGHGVKYTIGGDHDALVIDNAALALVNNGFSIDYGAEETTMNPGVDDNLTTKEKFQKFGEQVKNAFTPNSKTNKPLGESHGVTEGPNDATPSNTENQTKFEEGEYSSAPEATHSFTLEQLDEAFKNRDFSSFPPKAQKFLRNYLANTFVGYDKQGQPIIFNMAETMDYLTAKQANDIKQQDLANEKLNSAFPALNNFDEQRSMFPGAADDINKEQQQYNDNIASQQQKAKQDFDYALSLQPESEIANNNREMRDNTLKRTQQSNKYLDNAKDPLSAMRAANVAAPNYDSKTGIGSGNSTYPHDPLQVASITAKASQTPEKLTPKEQAAHSLYKNPEIKAIIDEHNPEGVTDVNTAIKNVMLHGTVKQQEKLLHALKNATYNGRNVQNSTTANLTADQQRVVNAATNMTAILNDFGTNEETTNWFKNVYQHVIDMFPESIKKPLLGQDPAAAKAALQKIMPLFAAGVAKQGAGATYLSTGLIKELKTLGMNDTAIMQLVGTAHSIAQNNLQTLSSSMNDNIYPLVSQTENMLEYNKTVAQLKLGSSLEAKGIEGKLVMHDNRPTVEAVDGELVSENDDGVVVVWNKSTKTWDERKSK